MALLGVNASAGVRVPLDDVEIAGMTPTDPLRFNRDVATRRGEYFTRARGPNGAYQHA